VGRRGECVCEGSGGGRMCAGWVLISCQGPFYTHTMEFASSTHIRISNTHLCDTHTNVHICTHHSTSLPIHSRMQRHTAASPPTTLYHPPHTPHTPTPPPTSHTPTPPPTCNKSVALPLFSTSISSVLVKKSLNNLESLSGFCRSGVPFVAIR